MRPLSLALLTLTAALAATPLPALGTPPGGPSAPAPGAGIAEGGAVVGPVVPPLPAPGPGVTFAGTWQVQTAAGAFHMVLTQDQAGNVSGTYTVADGRIIGGTVVRNQLFAQWAQDTLVGNLVFTLAPTGDAFSGRFSVGLIPVDMNNTNQFWNGILVAASPATPPPPVVAMPAPMPPPVAAPASGGAAGLALVTIDSNVRARPENGATSLGIARAGTSVPVVGCDRGWCQVAIAGMPSGYIGQRLLRFDGAAPPAAPALAATPMPAAPPPGVAALPPPPPAAAPPLGLNPTYTGSWDSMTGNGGRFAVTLSQVGTTVTGTYQPYNGTIAGEVDPSGRLIYRWRQDGGFTGMGVFQISPDGRTLAGSFGSTDNPFENSYSWFATRQQ